MANAEYGCLCLCTVCLHVAVQLSARLHALILTTQKVLLLSNRDYGIQSMESALLALMICIARAATYHYSHLISSRLDTSHPITSLHVLSLITLHPIISHHISSLFHLECSQCLGLAHRGVKRQRFGETNHRRKLRREQKHDQREQDEVRECNKVT